LWRAIGIAENMLEILDLAEGSDKTLRANETILENQPRLLPLATASAAGRGHELATKG